MNSFILLFAHTGAWLWYVLFCGWRYYLFNAEKYVIQNRAQLEAFRWVQRNTKAIATVDALMYITHDEFPFTVTVRRHPLKFVDIYRAKGRFISVKIK